MSKPFLILLLLLCINCKESGTKLKGTPFSSDESSKTLKNAFDGDLSTKFVSSLKEGWVGLELSSEAVITKIGFAFSSTQPKDYLLGVFQGANDKTFFDAFPLYMIKKELEPDELNYIDVSCKKKFKYIRYVGPEGKNSTISEFEIYGDSESEEVEEQNYYQPTNIPLLIINSENSVMPKDRDRDTKVVTNNILISDGKINTQKTGKIKLRGNSSLRSEKKPYALQFDEKVNILDIPSKAKKWVLVPNMYDKTLLRNLLGYHMSFIFGLKFTPSCRFIDLIINGNYRGNYLICDKIEVSKERLALSKMDESSNEEPEITGGYLLEGQGSKRKGDPSVFKTKQGITLSHEYPPIDEITEEQKEYIENKINAVEAEIYANNTENIDLESFVRYFLVEDFSANQDGIFNSFFIYKERGDEKIYFGPVWDFDLAFDNAQVLYPTNQKKNFAYKFALSNGSANKLVSQILSVEEVLKKVKDVWQEMTNTVFTKEIIIDYINEQVEYIDESQKLNFMKWDVLSSKQFMEAATRGTYKAEVDYLKEYIEERFDVFGALVESSTKESVLEETKRSGGWGGGDRPWGGNRGNRTWGNGENPWGNRTWGNGENPWGGNGQNPWGGNGDNPFGGNGETPFGGNGENPFGGNNP